MLKFFQGGIVSRGGNYENQARTNENNSEGAASLWKMLAKLVSCSTGCSIGSGGKCKSPP